jgi:uncharacterized protein YndB with AHSA1/START domain
MTEKKPNFVYTTYIRTTPEKLWEAITNPEFTRQYWGYPLVSDWKKGSKWEMLRASDNGVNVVGKVIENSPLKRLVLSWAEPERSEDVSQIAFEIEVAGELVRLDVIHSNLSEYMAGRISKGWPLVLSSLKSFLESGKPIDILAIKTCGPAKAA